MKKLESLSDCKDKLRSALHAYSRGFRGLSPQKNPKVRDGPEAAVPTHFGAPSQTDEQSLQITGKNGGFQSAAGFKKILRFGTGPRRLYQRILGHPRLGTHFLARASRPS